MNKNSNDAIIAIDESHHGHIIVMCTTNEDKIKIHDEYDVMSELEFTDVRPGLYYANMKMRPIYDDVEVDWVVTEPIYIYIIQKDKG